MADPSTLPLESNALGPFELVVCEGTSIRRLPLGLEATVGRDEQATIRLSSPAASRIHAVIRGGPAPTVEDRGSANGTRVNGRKLAAGEVAALDAHSIVVVAEAQIVVRRARAETAPVPSVPERSMDQVWKLVELAAPSELSILVLGETGVGKEVVARKIHALSPRARGPMIAINCAALHEATLESELFGHEKGAFTGAVGAKPGLLEAAKGGTVLLDEIGELPLPIQAKLLRALDAREVVPLGALRARAIDVRVVAATHRDLAGMVEAGTFRADLLFRLDGLTMHVPPLRDRPRDIVPLARDLAAEACAAAGKPRVDLTSDVEAALAARPWPGNVRELKKSIERALVLAGWKSPALEHFRFQDAPAAEPAADFHGERERGERRAIERALEQCDGNQTRAAKLLGISRRTLVDRLGRYGISRGKKT